MVKIFLIKQQVKFLNKTLIGKILNFIGKILFGKMAFITGYDPNGKEFYKTTTTYFLDKTYINLKETGYTELEEHSDIESVEIAINALAVKRRRNS